LGLVSLHITATSLSRKQTIFECLYKKNNNLRLGPPSSTWDSQLALGTMAPAGPPPGPPWAPPGHLPDTSGHPWAPPHYTNVPLMVSFNSGLKHFNFYTFEGWGHFPSSATLPGPGYPWPPPGHALASLGIPWHLWAPWGAPWHPLVRLGTPGHSCAPLGTPGHPWALSGTPGHRLAPLGTSGHRWPPLGTRGHPRAPHGRSLPPLGTPGDPMGPSLAPLGTSGHPRGTPRQTQNPSIYNVL
jgi:hypothetical protein